MKKKAVSGIVATILLTSMLASAFIVQRVKAEPETIYIRADGSVDPSTAAIKQVGNTYTFTDSINDSIVIEKDNVVVDGAGYPVQGTGSYLSAGVDLSGRTNVTVKNTQIKGFSYGIWLNSSSGNVISENNLTANGGYGVYLGSSFNNSVNGNNIEKSVSGVYLGSSSSNNSISGNNLTNNAYGFSLYSSSNNSMSGNNITSTEYHGIALYASSNNDSISGNNIANGFSGILLDNSSSSNIVSENTIANNSVDISLYSYFNIISGNTIADSSNGILLFSCSNNSISRNTFTDCSLSVWDSYQNSVENNIVNGKPLVYLEGVANYSVADAGQVILVRCDSIRVENLNLSRAGIGVQLWETNNSTVSGNDITANRVYGVFLFSSSSNSISGNTVANSSDGIRLYASSDNNSISGNNITTNGNNGLWLFSSSSNIISGNNVTSNKYMDIVLTSSPSNIISGNHVANSSSGVWLDFYSGNNTISGNNVTANSAFGIELGSSSNIVSGNTIANNDEGIWLGSSSGNSISENNITANHSFGIDLRYSSNNTIYHNSFENNHAQISSTVSENTWDDGYPSGGNHWSDYNGTDANGDSIGDAPYIIDANNTDRYPLMGWFSDFNATSENHVQTICNSTISDLQFNGTAITFNVSGENSAAGFCRIRIPTALMNATYRVFVNGTQVAYDLLPCSNETDSYIYFTYHTSTQEVTITPEFSTWTPILLTLITLTCATVIHKRRQHKTRVVARACLNGE